MENVKHKFDFDSNTVIATTTGGAMLGASIGNAPGLIVGAIVGVFAGAYTELRPNRRTTKQNDRVSANR